MNTTIEQSQNELILINTAAGLISVLILLMIIALFVFILIVVACHRIAIKFYNKRRTQKANQLGQQGQLGQQTPKFETPLNKPSCAEAQAEFIIRMNEQPRNIISEGTGSSIDEQKKRDSRRIANEISAIFKRMRNSKSDQLSLENMDEKNLEEAREIIRKIRSGEY